MRKIISFILGCILVSACQYQADTPLPSVVPATATTPPISSTATTTPETGIISAENVQRLKVLQTLGKGSIAGEPQYTPDGKWLVVSTSTGIYLYDASNYQAAPRLLTPEYSGYFAISPDSQTLTIGKTLFSVADGKQLPSLQLSSAFDDTHSLMDLRFSPDGRTLALANTESLIGLWYISDGSLLKTFEGQTIHFSPDGRFLLTSLRPASDGNNVHIYVYDIQEGKRLRDWYGESGELLPDGRALIQKGEKITIYELKTGRPLRVFEGQFGALAPDGESLLVLTQNVFRHYRIRDGKSLGILEGQFNGVNTVSARFSPDGQMIAASTYQAVCCGGTLNAVFSLWRADGPLVKNLHDENGLLPVGFFVFAPDSRALVFNNPAQDTLEILQTADAKSLAVLDGFTAPVTQLAFLPGSQQLVTSIYGNYRNPLTIYNVETGQIERSWPTNINSPDRGLAVHPNGQTLALSNQFWRISDGQITATSLTQKMIDVYSYAMQAVAFSPDGRYFAGGFFNYGRFQVWDFEKQTLLMDQNTCGEYAPVTGLAFSPDSQRLVVACLDNAEIKNSVISIYKVSAENKLIQVLRTQDSGSSNHVAYSPDGHYLAKVTSHLQLLDANNNQEIGVSSSATEIHSLSFSPDSKLLALGLENGEIELWAIPDGKLLATLPGHRSYNPVNALSFSENGKLLAAGYDDGSAIIWGLNH